METFTTARPKAKYSLVWAAKVFDALHAKHPRATDAVMELYGLTPRNMAALLAFGDPLWNYLRDLIKNIAHMGEYRPELLSVAYLERIALNSHHHCPDESLSQRLDKRLRTLHTKEAVVKGAGGGSESDRCPPSDPSVDALGRRWVQGALWP